jgi:hypothetical protein
MFPEEARFYVKNGTKALPSMGYPCFLPLNSVHDDSVFEKRQNLET